MEVVTTEKINREMLVNTGMLDSACRSYVPHSVGHVEMNYVPSCYFALHGFGSSVRKTPLFFNRLSNFYLFSINCYFLFFYLKLLCKAFSSEYYRNVLICINILFK